MPTHLSTNSLLELADTTETLALLSLELSSPSWTASTSSISNCCAALPKGPQMAACGVRTEATSTLVAPQEATRGLCSTTGNRGRPPPRRRLGSALVSQRRTGALTGRYPPKGAKQGSSGRRTSSDGQFQRGGSGRLLGQPLQEAKGQGRGADPRRAREHGSRGLRVESLHGHRCHARGAAALPRVETPRRNPSCPLQVRPIRAAVVGFLDEGRQGDASQLQQEDPPRVVQRGGHKLSRLLRHQIRGADDAAFSFARPAPRCGALQPATSRAHAALRAHAPECELMLPAPECEKTASLRAKQQDLAAASNTEKLTAVWIANLARDVSGRQALLCADLLDYTTETPQAALP